jgi:hypothetical protein
LFRSGTYSGIRPVAVIGSIPRSTEMTTQTRLRIDDVNGLADMDSDARSTGTLAGVVRGAVLGALMVGAVLVGSGMNREGVVVKEASAAALTDRAAPAGYFPAQFPAPQGAPEPHIEAF